ncbi:hypothetical protein BDW22DRAFT_1430696 [Trametopsis cervina]|nr:hypothetical protein BDW22DRAFT_1430696 [Trametopsis cervina]
MSKDNVVSQNVSRIYTATGRETQHDLVTDGSSFWIARDTTSHNIDRSENRPADAHLVRSGEAGQIDKSAGNNLVNFTNAPMPPFRRASPSTHHEHREGHVQFTESSLPTFRPNAIPQVTFGTNPTIDFTFNTNYRSPHAPSASEDVRFTHSPLPRFRGAVVPPAMLSPGSERRHGYSFPHPPGTAEEVNFTTKRLPSFRLPAVLPTLDTDSSRPMEDLTFTEAPLPTFRPSAGWDTVGRKAQGRPHHIPGSGQGKQAVTFSTTPLPSFRISPTQNNPSESHVRFTQDPLPRFGMPAQGQSNERPSRSDSTSVSFTTTNLPAFHIPEKQHTTRPQNVKFVDNPLPTFRSTSRIPITEESSNSSRHIESHTSHTKYNATTAGEHHRQQGKAFATTPLPMFRLPTNTAGAPMRSSQVTGLPRNRRSSPGEMDRAQPTTHENINIRAKRVVTFAEIEAQDSESDDDVN